MGLLLATIPAVRVTRREIRDLWRAVAKAYARKGDKKAAKQARTNARLAGA